MALDLLEQILPQVKSHIYPARIPISNWKIKVGEIPNGFSVGLKDNNWTEIHPPQAQWGAYDTTFWFRSKVTVPQEFSGLPIMLLLDIREGLLYLNGKPYHGLDGNHSAVFLADKARANQTYALAIQAYSGRQKDQAIFSRAELAVLNPTARALHTGLTLARELENFYGQGSPESKEMRELIRRTLIYLKYFKPDGEEYPNAIARAYRFFLQTLETEFRTEMAGIVHLIGQAHLDVAWLWTLRETRRKAGRTFSTILRLLEEFPEFRFVQSQPLLYEFVKNDYPDLFRQIKQRVAEGRWEPVGGMWVEPDCNLPGGESLVRQICYGKKFFRDEFGIEAATVWLPDTFGFPWTLPQVLRKSGITSFFTTKLTWNDTTKFPHHTFWWEGIDGSRVLSHIPPVGLEGQPTPGDLRKSWDEFAQKDLQNAVIQTYGYGDGGGGPTREQIHTIALFKSLPAFPSTKISGVKEFFSAAGEQSRDLPVWKSELYLEKHRGTYTTLGRIKRANRELERMLYSAEFLSTLTFLNGGKRYPHADLEQAWKQLLSMQFHDIICGTCVPDVYEDVGRDIERIRAATDLLSRKALAALTKPIRKRAREHQRVFWNTLPWSRNEYVEISVKSKEKYFTVIDSRGKVVEHQLLGRSRGTTALLCFLEDIPPFSSLGVTVTPSAVKPTFSADWKVSSRVIETPVFRLRLDTQGHFTSIHDKRLRRELIKQGSRANVLQTYHDTPQQWEAWDLDAHYEGKRADILAFRSFKVLERGPLRLRLEVIRRSERGSVVTQHISFYHKSPRIDFTTTAKWADPRILLKAAFPLNTSTNQATYEIQFGAIQRPTKPKSAEDKAKFEVPAQQWADLSEQKFGISLLNDSKYGYDARETTLRLTLLRSPRGPHETEPWKLSGQHVQDIGDHWFTYALFPHAGDWRRGETIRRARELNHPLLAYEHALPKAVHPLLASVPPNICVDAVKKAEDNREVIVRLHEAHGESGRSRLEFGYLVEQASECDLMENTITKLKPSRGKVTLKFAPFEIKTLRVKLRGRKL